MRKTVPFTRQGIDELPNNSPAVSLLSKNAVMADLPC